MTTSSIPVIQDDTLSKWGISKEEFISKFSQHEDRCYSLKTKDYVNRGGENEWCVLLTLGVESSNPIYLYLSQHSSEFSFSSLTDWSDVLSLDKRECEELVDYIKTQRSTRCPDAEGVIRAYNSFTGEFA